jgi:hypothetical protein
VETAARVEAARRTRGLTTVAMAADLPKVTNAATESSMFRFLRGSATPSDMAVQRAANVFAPALRHIPRTRYTHLPATRDVTGKYTLDTLNPTHFHEMSINVASELCAAKGWRELLTRFWVAVLADPSKTRTAATKPKAASSPSGVRRWHRPTHRQGRLGPPTPPLGCGPTAATARYSSLPRRGQHTGVAEGDRVDGPAAAADARARRYRRVPYGGEQAPLVAWCLCRRRPCAAFERR